MHASVSNEFWKVLPFEVIGRRHNKGEYVTIYVAPTANSLLSECGIY